MFQKLRNFLGIFGPGIVTGAADDDPSGIATYTQTGAQFGYGQLWTALLLLPLLIAVQEAVARIGIIHGKGLVSVIREHYTPKVVVVVVGLVLVANTINIGADLGAMAAAAQLLIPVNFALLTIIFTVTLLLAEIFFPYRKYRRILKWLCLSLFAYVLTLFVVHLPLRTVLQATIFPHIELSTSFLFIITGVFGTTISPYMFFWQASQEVEELREQKLLGKKRNPKALQLWLRRMRIDNAVGMIASQCATWAIIVVAGTVLHQNGITNIQTAADAARALEPLVQTFPYSGVLAKILFASGVIGLGSLAVPVLAGSASYALSEALGWKEGLNLQLKKAKGFYGVIIVSTLIGLLMNFIGINPIQALVYAAVLNGVAAVPLLFLITFIVRSHSIMGQQKCHRLSEGLLWATSLGMTGAVIGLFISLRAQ